MKNFSQFIVYGCYLPRNVRREIIDSVASTLSSKNVCTNVVKQIETFDIRAVLTMQIKYMTISDRLYDATFRQVESIYETLV